MRCMIKRLFDIVFSVVGLVFLSPLFAAASVLIKLDSAGPVFFRQERIGRYFRPFRIYKFRTMTAGGQDDGALITVGGDKRITPIGHVLRRYKIDELPQLLNILKGEMSFVGPRPEVREYVQLFKKDYVKLLTVRPGITDPASLTYSEEERVLASSGNWEKNYTCNILPDKIALSLRYVESRNIFTDVTLVLRTILKIAETR
jgi:lipopolysaccharide/colanic/teichoic acid biosynthesis glycosyltransferase